MEAGAWSVRVDEGKSGDMPGIGTAGDGVNVWNGRKGEDMPSSSAIKWILLLGLLFVASSCSTFSFPPLSHEPVRLVSLQMPDVVREELPYDAILTYNADEEPEFKNVCFRWMAEQIYTRSPSLYCYSAEDWSTQRLDPTCVDSLEDLKGQTSPVFCVGRENMRLDYRGRLIVRFHPRDVKPVHNRLECYVEYYQDGKLLRTNRVSARVAVER
jgi:hypothetical protein